MKRIIDSIPVILGFWSPGLKYWRDIPLFFRIGLRFLWAFLVAMVVVLIPIWLSHLMNVNINLFIAPPTFLGVILLVYVLIVGIAVAPAYLFVITFGMDMSYEEALYLERMNVPQGFADGYINSFL